MKKFKLGDFVYLVSDPHKQSRQIIGIKIAIDGGGYYEVVLGSDSYNAYESELVKYNK